VAKFDDEKVEELLRDEGIIRNRLKVKSAINNARVFLEIQNEFGSFDKYIWGFVDGKPVSNRPKKGSDYQASTPLSDEISKDLKDRGMSFVGTTIVYAHLQATGIVNDHMEYCDLS
jgi:DNA-3-methyladenine glycosylase I